MTLEQEYLAEADEIIAAAFRQGKISRRLLRSGIAQVIGENACRHCQITRTEADQMDADLRIDRFHHSINGKVLPPRVWAAFEMLYHLRQPASYNQFLDEGIVRPSRRKDGDESHIMRHLVWGLRRNLANSGFSVVSYSSFRDGIQYELIDCQR